MDRRPPSPGELESPELDQVLQALEGGEIRSILEIPEGPLLAAYFRELKKGPKEQNLRLVLALERFVKLKYDAHGKVKGRGFGEDPDEGPKPKKGPEKGKSKTPTGLANLEAELDGMDGAG